MSLTYDNILEAYQSIKSRIKEKPEFGLILGSGLGNLTDKIVNPIEIEYKDIPFFPATTVKGHEGKLVFGKLADKNVVVMKGRFHYYEGHEMSIISLGVRIFKLLGVNKIILTNAAGGVNKSFKAGDLMIITDHLGFFAPSILRGKNLDEFGPRFPDMSNVYDKDGVALTEECSKLIGLNIKKGIYSFSQGPVYETPAEIRAVRILGADAVGMSTVPEAIVAAHSGMKVIAISCITNMAAGVLNAPLSHNEVIDTASKVEKEFKKLIVKILSKWED